MKTRCLLITLLIATRLSAQYNVVISTTPYTELTGATELTYDPGQAGYYHALPFTFPAFKRTADFSLQSAVPSNGAYITPKGYIAVYEKPGYKNTIVYQALYSSILDYMAGITKVSVKMEGAAPNRIAKVQWKDMVYSGDASQKVNIQAWLHEATGSVAYHFGPNSITNKALLSSYCGIVVFDPPFTTLLDQFNIKGDYALLQTIAGQATLSSTMTGLPDEGKVLTFNRAATTGIETVTTRVDLHPNPAKDVVSVQATTGTTIAIINSMGQIMFSEKATGQTQISVADYPAGIYRVTTTTNNSTASNTLVITR
jgi:hypothetical protein